MSGKERAGRLAALGYRLVRNYPCPIRRRKMPYATLPVSSGSVVVHGSLDSVDARIKGAEMIRGWESELPIGGGE